MSVYGNKRNNSEVLPIFQASNSESSAFKYTSLHCSLRKPTISDASFPLALPEAENNQQILDCAVVPAEDACVAAPRRASWSSGVRGEPCQAGPPPGYISAAGVQRVWAVASQAKATCVLVTSACRLPFGTPLQSIPSPQPQPKHRLACSGSLY